MMPGMSGWEVCRKIRQDAALAHTGVLMFTGIGESLNEATSPLFGADEYIDKPFDFELLDEKVMSVLERRAAQREAVPRPVSRTRSVSPRRAGNGVDGPASAVAAARSRSKRPRTAKPRSSQPQTKRRHNGSVKAEKGKRTTAPKNGATTGANQAKK